MGGMAGCGFEDALHIVQAAVGRSACLGTVESMVTGAFPHIILVLGFLFLFNEGFLELGSVYGGAGLGCIRCHHSCGYSFLALLHTYCMGSSNLHRPALQVTLWRFWPPVVASSRWCSKLGGLAPVIFPVEAKVKIQKTAFVGKMPRLVEVDCCSDRVLASTWVRQLPWRWTGGGPVHEGATVPQQMC
jgi:hypothetical protein